MKQRATEDHVTSERLPIVLSLAAVGSAVLFSFTDSPAVSDVSQSLFAMCRGLALVLWGFSARRKGHIRGKNTRVYQEKNPTVFTALVFGKFFIPGFVMLAAGLWFALTGSA